MKKQAIILLASLLVIPSVAQEIPMDYSYCGYHRSETSIPSAKVAIYLTPQQGDNTARLQEAIDYVSKQKPDKQTGLRGAILLAEGIYTLNDPVYIRTSGVILRGSGRDKTILRKAGYDRGALLYMEGIHDLVGKDTMEVADTFVKAGSTTLQVKGKVNAGERIMIWRPSTEEWIASLHCQSFGGGKRMGYWAWHPGDIDIRWSRTVTSVKDHILTLDAPITSTLEQRWGGAKVIRYEHLGLIRECGVENLTMESEYQQTLPKDEDHCWNGIYLADAEDCWVRMVNFRHFAGSAVVIQKSAGQVTVEDCKSLHPVSEIGGSRRRTFLTFGEKTLFQRCYSEQGINDFAVGHTAPGPNAFVQCESKESLGPSGSIGSWAPGLLYDCVNIDGHDLVFKNWELEKFGAGWNTANSMMWQSTASGLFCYSPDSLNRNFSRGCWGQVMGNGEYTEMNEHVKPYSLFADQLRQRLGREVKAQCRVHERNTNASSSPTIEEAMKMAEEALLPRTTMEMWIDAAQFEGDITPGKHLFSLQNEKSEVSSATTYTINNGWLCQDGTLLVGNKHQTPWWNGRPTDAAMAKAKYALTRFVPDQEGTGATDRVDSVIAIMQREHTLLFSQNYGLWTDRRRDDHERIRRKNGDAWAPFYEQPFARTGIDTAWDGMSKYDLTQLNKWYFYRLQQFAERTRPIGLLLKNQHYFQHNILEAGAHWVDCPWRTANNINHTPFLEPVNFTGDKRIFTATLFYDITNPTLRELHRQYIRQSLDAFKGQPNVIHSIGEEFTGPLHFVEFWLDVIAEWEQENGQVLVDLAVNKDVQDAILNDPVRSKVVDIIDIEQWFYHHRGEYAPPGGVNMAQRQYMRKIRTGGARFEDVYRAVSEYKRRFPAKAVIYSAQKFPELGWASLMAGGSCANIPVKDPTFLKSIATMQPEVTDGGYLLKSDDALLLYRTDTAQTTINIPYQGTLYQVDEQSGTIEQIKGVKGNIPLPGKGIFWIVKKT